MAGWLFLAALLAAAVVGAVTAPKIAVVILFLAAVTAALGHVQTQRDRAHLLQLASSREGQSICEFARDFDTRAVDTWILRAVHEELQARLKAIHPAFPMRAGDDLKLDLRLDDDDLDMDLALAIEERTGRSLEDTSTNPLMGQVKTVRDLVLFFQHQSKKSSC